MLLWRLAEGSSDLAFRPQSQTDPGSNPASTTLYPQGLSARSSRGLHPCPRKQMKRHRAAVLDQDPRERWEYPMYSINRISPPVLRPGETLSSLHPFPPRDKQRVSALSQLPLAPASSLWHKALETTAAANARPLRTLPRSWFLHMMGASPNFVPWALQLPGQCLAQEALSRACSRVRRLRHPLMLCASSASRCCQPEPRERAGVVRAGVSGQ